MENAHAAVLDDRATTKAVVFTPVDTIMVFVEVKKQARVSFVELFVGGSRPVKTARFLIPVHVGTYLVW